MMYESRKLLSWTSALALLVGIAAAMPNPAAAQSAEPGQAVVESRDWDGIALEPRTGFERATLVVVGPEGYRAEHEFEAGELPAIDVLGLDDGGYRYELRLVTAGAPEDPPVVARASGAFAVTGGQLVRAEDDGGAPTSGAITNDQVITDDLVVQGRACIGGSFMGVGCVDGVDFSNNVGFSTLTLWDRTPQIFFDAFSLGGPATDFAIEAQGFELNIYNEDANRRIMGIDTRAALDSIFVGEGAVGLFTSVPQAALEVTKSDGTAQILVNENSTTTAKRQLLVLENKGRAQTRLTNTATGVNWVAGMGTEDSYIMRRGANEYRFTKVGRVLRFVDGVEKYRFDPNGNLTIAGTLIENSDVDTKRDIEPVDGASVLAQVAALPVSTWTYKADETGARHVGPMAQDFHAAFGLGENDTTISPRDVAGVALAAVKELQEIVRQKDAQLAALNERLAALEAVLAR